ncbi:unnamed protein product [Leptidea sinapis]|uniref:Fibrinogen C-terminal domain-containing protein n=1 Tax=Leptidea sinapis TaxID=189913 RepID=A0A5E4QMV4_9NEOP|nr:unnamed protein product [Leptidea sinapis]
MDIHVSRDLHHMAKQIEILKTTHSAEITRMKRDIEYLKQNQVASISANHIKSERATLHWVKNSIKDLRIEMREMNHSVNNSALLRHVQVIKNQRTKTHENRIDKLDNKVVELTDECQQIKETIAELKAQIEKLQDELRLRDIDEMRVENLESKTDENESDQGSHKIRHQKMLQKQLYRLSRTQEQIVAYQRNLQDQLLEGSRRIHRLEELNLHLIATKVENFDTEYKALRADLQNVSRKMSDFDKVHASLLELREDVENIENKVDKTIPEFRKEISKLDVSFAKLHAETSYLKENQENVKQTMKAIAVTVSNVMERVDVDHSTMDKLNESVVELKATSKQHFYRLNDHILKSEANHVDTNFTQALPLPELMGEVKELQSVQREYEDLVDQLPKDCSNISQPGVYLIHPDGSSEPRDVWCQGGGTVLQRRYNGSVEFNRIFAEYERGFGEPAGELWLGLAAMHALTADNCSSMRIDMTDIYGMAWFAHYELFTVGSAETGYVLEVGGYQGNASDAFDYQNHMQFSAIDLDRDISNTHCAANYEGGWWFSHCQHVNINGKYNLGLTWFDATRNEWIAVATTEMRIIRRPGCAA